MNTVPQENKPPRSTGKSAALVALGILLSRIAGLIRERIFAHYFGNSDAADVFKAALRIPNFLQNLFGEGVLSASFIPVYARLRAEGKEEEARNVAVGVGLLLLILVMCLVTIGIFFTPLLIDLIAPGFQDEKRMHAIDLVRILFPGVGLLVMSAWCLGILNSHGRFFLSYTAPILWNLAIIGVLLAVGDSYGNYELALIAGWGVVLGSVLQTVVQLPSTFGYLGLRRFSLGEARAGLKRVVSSFSAVFVGRGVVQISAYIDSMLASLLPGGAVSALAYAQTIYLLPVSLFGMAISAAELPTMSGFVGSTEETYRHLTQQLNRALARIAFFVVPSSVLFISGGDFIARILFQSGRFTADDSLYVWGILAGSAVGLLAATMGRLYASAFYALQDPKTPLRFAIVRVILTLLLGYFFAMMLPPLVGVDMKWGVAGLTASAGLAGWVEFFLLQRKLNSLIGQTGTPGRKISQLWGAALLGAGLVTILRFTIECQTVWCAFGSIVLYSVTYGLATTIMGISEASLVTAKLAKLFSRKHS